MMRCARVDQLPILGMVIPPLIGNPCMFSLHIQKIPSCATSTVPPLAPQQEAHNQQNQKPCQLRTYKTSHARL